MKNQIFGGLIEFEDRSKLIEFIETMDISTVIKIIEASIEYGTKNGLYTSEEVYCLFKCIVKLQPMAGTPMAPNNKTIELSLPGK